MSTAREILKQSDALNHERNEINRALTHVGQSLNSNTSGRFQVSVGDGWINVNLAVLRTITDALRAEVDSLTEQIAALEARVQVVEP